MRMARAQQKSLLALAPSQAKDQQKSGVPKMRLRWSFGAIEHLQHHNFVVTIMTMRKFGSWALGSEDLGCAGVVQWGFLDVF